MRILWIGLAALLFSIGCSVEEKASECRPPFSAQADGSAEASLRFFALGDSGSEALYATAEALTGPASLDGLDLVLLLGDNFYPQGIEGVYDPKWLDLFEKPFSDPVWRAPFYAVLGNHDYLGSIDAQIIYSSFSDRWRMPARYYRFTYTLDDEWQTQIAFFALDTNELKVPEKNGPQLAWLAGALRESEARWKVVFGHHPVFSNGKHGNDPYLISVLESVLAENKVNLYLCGHDHDLQILTPVSGVHYLISGSASQPRKTRCSDNSIYAAGRQGGLILMADHDQITVSPYLAEGGIDYRHVIAHPADGEGE